MAERVKTNHQNKHCLFCGDDERVKSLYPQTFDEAQLTPATFSARRETEHFHYEIVRCERCGLVFSRRLLPEEKLLELYGQSSVTFSEYMSVLRRDYWAPLERVAGNLKGRRALEIGCSSGFFLEEMLDRGAETVVGFEPSVEAKRVASERVRESIVTGFFEGTGNDEASYDLACSFHTLDHMSDPKRVVNACGKALKPGGLVYFVTHDVDALQAKVLGEKSPIFDVEHVYLFNKTTLPRLLEENGFDVVSSGNLRNSYPLRYWIRMMPLPGAVKSGVQTALRMSGIGQWSPAIPAGNIYAIARKRA